MAHTAGPWAWYGNARNREIYLATKHSGRRYVMGFRRWGMSGAQPMFQPAERGLVPAETLLAFEVGNRDVRGYEQAKADDSVYRYDICGIDCDDARLIAAAPELLAALIECRRVLFDRIPRLGPEGPNSLEEQAEYEEVGGTWSMADRAIAKATGAAE